MNILEFKLKLAGRPYREEGNDGGGSAAGNAARNGMGFGGTGSGIGGDRSFSGTGGWSGVGANQPANPMSTDAATAARNVVSGVGSTTVSSNNQTLGINNVIGMAGGTNMSESFARELQRNGFGETDVSPDQNVNNVVASRNVNNVLGVVAPMLASTVPGYSLARAGIALSQADSPMSAAKSFIGSLLASKINNQVAKALGPEAGQALATYNSVAPLTRAVGFDTPSVNVGGAVVNGLVSGTGQAGLQTGPSAPDGSGIPAYGGWSKSSGATSTPAPASKPTGNVVSRVAAPAALKDGTSLGSAIRQGIQSKWGKAYGSGNE